MLNRTLGSLITLFALTSMSPSYASHCDCNSKCAQDCASGKTDKCDCEGCDCHDGGQCHKKD